MALNPLSPGINVNILLNELQMCFMVHGGGICSIIHSVGIPFLVIVVYFHEL